MLSQLLAGLAEPDDEERDQLCHSFRQIVGFIVLLADPLSTVSLAKLLSTTKRKVDRQLHLLRSVHCVSSDPNAPVYPFHLSFREFLVKHSKDRYQWFAIDETNTHQYLIDRCLALLQGPDGLCKDICRLGRPGAKRKEIDDAAVNVYIPRYL